MDTISKTFIFLGDLLLLFIMMALEEFGLHNIAGLIFAVFLVILSVIGNIYFFAYIRKIRKKYQVHKRTIQSIDDRTNLYLMYLISFISLVPLFLEGNEIIQLLIFSLFILTIYSDYLSSEILFYNPVLGLFGYKYFKVYTANDGTRGEIFIIAGRKKYNEIKVNQEVSLYILTDYLYVLI